MYSIVLNPERLSRITSFLDVESNRSDSGYQLWQGIIAFGVGGIEGVGLGSGQQQMSFLPEAHTDFSIIGEELGLFFSMGVALLFLALLILVLFQLKYVKSLSIFIGSRVFAHDRISGFDQYGSCNWLLAD